MQPRLVFENLPWRRVRAGRSASQAVPRLAGVYAYASVQERFGLPMALEWLYIGKAKRLDRRLGQHDPARESNSGLGKWLAASHATSELWYAVLDPNDLNFVEQELIREIRPRFNVRLYGGSK